MKILLRALALLLMASTAHAQLFYNKSTYPPTGAKKLFAANYNIVCDGTTDNTTAFTAMNTAMAALGSAGGSLYFAPQAGVCITGQGLNPKSNMLIYAEPGTVTLKPGATHSTVLLMSISGASNITIYGLTFDGGGADYSASSPNANVTQVFQSSNILFDHVTWQHTRGIALVPSTSIVNMGIVNSTFTDIGNHWKTTLTASDRKQAIGFCCGTTSANVGNFAKNNYFSDIGLDAISTGSQTDFEATGNICELANNQVALLATSAYAACVYFTGNVGGLIANNVVNGASGNGIDTNASTNFAITGNYVRGSGSAGIGLFGNDAYVTVTGNTVLDNGSWGAATWQGGITTGDTTTNVTISGNTACDDQTPKIQPYGFQFAVHSAANPIANGIVFGPNNFNCNLTSAFGGTNAGTAGDLGIYRSNQSSQSVSELSGDVTTSGSNVTTIAANAVTLAKHATQATNTILGNATSGTAVPSALAVGTCSTSASALNWTTNTGFGCNTSINAATLGGATFAAPGAIGGGTPAAGAFTTLTSSSGIALGSLATQATNTVTGNATNGTAVPTALAVGTCSTAASALKWTTNTGFGCNTAIDATTLGTTTFAAPGPIGSGTPSTGAFTTLSSTSPPTVNGVANQYVLAQWGIPVILPGGGTFTTTPSAASGLTLTTALPNTAACTSTIGCYMYFPLGAICTTCNAGGNSAAGSYFTQCASTTLCSVFNNVLGTGVPATVGAPTSFGTITTSGAYTQTVGSFVTLATISIPGNAMGANGNFGFEQLAARPNNAGTIMQQVKYAGNIVGLNGLASVQSIALHRIVQNIGFTGKQIADVGQTPLEMSQINTAVQFTTVDTTTAQNLTFQGELITSATDWLVTFGGTVWVTNAP